MLRPIYLDHAATTPLRPEVREAMEPFLADNFANPSSIYRPAQAARSALDAARDTVAMALGVRPAEVIFTGGGTESDNAAVKGAALPRVEHGRHLVTTAIEHHAVLHPMEDLASHFGFELTVVPVERSGIIDPAMVERAIRPDTTLISLMWANNEIGTIQPVEAVARLAKARGITVHVDAVQAVGSLPVDLSRLPIDLLSLSAHKFYGPKGVGALVVRSGTPWWPLLAGGAQERNRRAGTENVAGIVGMAAALRLAEEERECTAPRLLALRDLLMEEVPNRMAGVQINGDIHQRLPNNANFSFEGVHGESLLVGLDLANVMASSGSACTSGSLEPSHVLQAIGVPARLAQGSLRLTVGRENTRDEILRTLDVLEALVARLRNLNPAARGA